MKNSKNISKSVPMTKWKFFDKLSETFFSLNHLNMLHQCLNNKFGTITNKTTFETWKYSCNEIADKFILVKVL